MKKFTLRLCFSILAVLYSLCISAGDIVEVGILRYEITGAKEVAVDGFANKKDASELIIPESVTIDGESYAVTSINSTAFNENSTITKIVIPKSVKKIEKRAFCNVDKLVEVEFNEGLEYIGEDAFYCCFFLKKVKLPNSLKKIDYNAFVACISLEEITLPNNLQWIDAYCFDGTKWLSDQPDGPVYLDNVLLQFKGKVDNEVQVKSGIKLVAAEAFRDCKSIVRCIFPEGLKRIERRAFYGCEKLNYVYVPDDVEYIHDDAFDSRYPTILSLSSTCNFILPYKESRLNYQIRRSGSNMNICNSVTPQTTSDVENNAYVPGGSLANYKKAGFNNISELYSYQISCSGNDLLIKIKPNFDFVKIKNVSYGDFYDMRLDTDGVWKFNFDTWQARSRSVDMSGIITVVTYKIDNLEIKTYYDGEVNNDISTAISHNYVDKNHTERHYDILGNKISSLQKGIHIVKNGSKSGRKIVVH